MRDSVFEGVLLELPVDAVHVEIEVLYSYNVPGIGTHKSSVRRFFASKSGATFARETAKVEDAVKKIGKDVQEAVTLVRAFEDRIDKRLRKLEKKDGSGSKQQHPSTDVSE